MQKEKVLKPPRNALLDRFRQTFPEATIQVEDQRHLHLGHAGAASGGGHFRVEVINAGFRGVRRITRQRLVYRAASDWIPERMQALNIFAMTLEEAEQQFHKRNADLAILKNHPRASL